MSFDKEKAQAVLAQAQAEWKRKGNADGDRDGFFFWAGCQYGTELTQALYKESFPESSDVTTFPANEEGMANRA